MIVIEEYLGQQEIHNMVSKHMNEPMNCSYYADTCL